MSTIQNLFTELCKRGCTIETRSKYPTDHLPQCLVKINDDIIDPVYSEIPAVFHDNKTNFSYHVNVAFKISSIIPGSINIYFLKHKRQPNSDYTGLRLGKMEKPYVTYKAIMRIDGYSNVVYIDKDIYTSKPYHDFNKGNNIEELDYLTNILHYETQIIKNIPSPHFIFSSQLNVLIDAISENNIHFSDTILHKNLKTKMIQNFINTGMLEYLRVLDIFLPTDLKLLIINLFMQMDNWDNLGIQMDFCTNRIEY